MVECRRSKLGEDPDRGNRRALNRGISSFSRTAEPWHEASEEASQGEGISPSHRKGRRAHAGSREKEEEQLAQQTSSSRLRVQDGLSPVCPYVPLRSPTPHFLPHPLPIISLNHALCDPFSWPRSSPPRAYPTHLPPLHPANQSRPDQASPLAATQRRNLSIHEYLAMNLMNDVSRA